MDVPIARVAGVILLLVSISWNRMGPSDSRYRIALVVATVGIALVIGRDLLAPSDLYDRLSSDDASQDMGVVIVHFAMWALLLDRLDVDDKRLQGLWRHVIYNLPYWLATCHFFDLRGLGIQTWNQSTRPDEGRVRHRGVPIRGPDHSRYDFGANRSCSNSGLV